MLYLAAEITLMHAALANPMGTAAALDAAARATVVARFPRFVLACGLSAVVWSVTFAVTVPRHGPAAILALAAELAALGGGAWTMRRTRADGPVVVVYATTIAVSVAMAALFAAVGAHAEALGFAVFTLSALSALLFPWGWRRALALTFAMLVVFAFGASSLPLALPWSELAPVVAIAAVLCVALAEGHARNFRATLRRRWSEDEARRELATSRDTYRDITENARDFIWASDREGRLTYINEAGARILGFAPADLIGRNVDQYISRDPQGAGPAELRAHLASGGTLPATIVEWTTVAGRTWVEVLAHTVRDAAGTVVGFRGISRDITGRRLAEAALRESEERYRGLVETQSALIYRADLAGNLTFLNEACRRTYGVEDVPLAEMNFLSFVHPDEADAARAALADVAALGRYRRVSRGRTPAGWIWIEWEVSAITDAGGTVVEVQGVGHDVTERRAADEALRESLAALREREEQLRLMGLRQNAIREEERKRLGFDLHEGVCQELVGIGILIASARQRGVSAPAGETLERAEGYLRTVSEHLRLLARELRPLQLSDLGLGECIRTLAKGMAGPRTSVSVTVPAGLPRLVEETEVAVYRVAQEALANAIRHAEARSVALTLEQSNGTLALEVRDDGRGFERAALETAALGLVAMEERAAAIGGRLEVRSSPGAGTMVRLECPVAP